MSIYISSTIKWGTDTNNIDKDEINKIDKEEREKCNKERLLLINEREKKLRTILSFHN